MSARALMSRLRNESPKSKEAAAILFVHGFDNSFADAARRTAQLAYDLELPVAPMMFSWPSQARATPEGYAKDRTNATWAVTDLREVLKTIAAEAGQRKIHIIAHSLGTEVVSRTLASLAEDGDTTVLARVDVVALAAPDIDADTFKRDIAPNLVRASHTVTLYASKHDEALVISKTFNGYPRAGDAGAGLVLFRGIDTVDASEVETDFVGHSYFGGNRRVILDIAHLIDGVPPPRSGYLQRTRDGLTYWEFQPETPTYTTPRR
jgi:esterase/lipase superfamily enzyme